MNLNIILIVGTEQVVSASQITIHGDYLVDKDDHDIALMILSEKAKLSDYINPICLPSKDDMLNDQSECYVSGKAPCCSLFCFPSLFIIFTATKYTLKTI